MQVRGLMTCEVRTCRPEETLNEAARAMWEGDCGCVPVVDDSGRVVGMLTDRDVCMAAYTQGKPLAAIPVAAAMAKQVVSCHPDDELASAQRSMQKARVRRLPVVNAQDRLTGILSLNDLVRQAFRERGQKARSVSVEEVAVTMAAMCEPRTPTTSAAKTAAPALASSSPAPTREMTLLAAGASDPQC